MTAFRLLPALDGPNDAFWTSGRDGVLRITRCRSCGTWLHPAPPACSTCWSRDLAPEPVSGRATLLTFTVNHQRWQPDLDEPYVIGIVGLPEQEGLHLTTNVVDVPVDEVRIGMPLEVTFEDHDPVFVPLFRPASAGAVADGGAR